VTADATTLAAVAVLSLATLVRSALGFGEALVAVPLLALVMPVQVAAPVAALVSVTVAAVVLVQDWSHVHARSAARLVLSTFLGIPFGLLLLTRVPEPVVNAALACVIVAFSTYSLSGRRGQVLDHDRLAWAFGLAAGVLGGAYGMNGPPLVIYGVMRGWSPAQFRATLQGYFLPASAAILGGYWLAGLWTPTVNHYYVLSLPAVLAATLAGRLVHRRLRADRFFTAVHLGLAAIGVLLLAQALRSY
jgi:uncharacterized membrane protein YfcA